MVLTAQEVKRCALDCGFDLAGIAPVDDVADFERFRRWVDAGMAGEMHYLTDRRAGLRQNVRQLLPSAQSVLCVGKLYNGPEPDISALNDPQRGWIARYAWGDDYHDVLRHDLERVVERLQQVHQHFEYKICVDTAPLLERSLARLAGLGWIGKNTCLINQQQGSWFFLAELLLSIPLQPDAPPPDRCGTCTRCIDACPTDALVPDAQGRWQLDARRCISYLTIELRGPMPEELREGVGTHIFGCDICQDVCPWNRKAPTDRTPEFAPRHFAPPLDELVQLDELAFKESFADSPIKRSKHSGFLRNVLTAIGNAPSSDHIAALEKLIQSPDPAVAEHARWALSKIEEVVA